jgi:hypothetical protein
MTTTRFLLIFALVAVMFAVGMERGEKPLGLIVTHRQGWTYVNTNPEQIKRLNPWNAPRINLRAQWFEGMGDLTIEMDIIYYAEGRGLCPEVEWFNPEVDDPLHSRQWQRIQVLDYRQQQRVSNQVTVLLTPDIVNRWAWMKTRLTLRVCGHVFSPEHEEVDNFRQLAELMR